MAEPAAGLQAAIKEALEESQYPTDEVQADDSWDSFEGAESPKPAAPAALDAAPSEDKPEDEQPATTEASEGQEATDAPESYWGVDLTGIPSEKRAEVIAHFEQQDSTIRKLQERMAAAVKPTEAPPAPAEPEEEITDEALLRALELNPEDLDVQQAAPMVLPLARTLLQLEEKVDAMSARETTREVETQWNTALNDLEGTYGPLPGDRLQQLKYAVDEGVGSPYELYFRLTAPIRREVETAATEARRTALKRESTAGVRPTSSGATEPPPAKGMSLKDAVTLAAKQAEKESGLKWKDAVRRRIVRTPGAE